MTRELCAIHLGGVLCSEPEHSFDETYLSNDIALCEPAHLPLTNHVHRLVPLDRSQRTIHRSEPEAGSNPLLHEAMILLQNIIQIWTGPDSTTTTHCATIPQ